MMNISLIHNGQSSFRQAYPFNHYILDNFFPPDLAQGLESEFPFYDSPQWHLYKNSIEDKKTLNDWNQFGPLTYKCFTYLCSKTFVDALSELCGVQLFPDIGLHGGGWHIHGNGGNLNPHLDYSIHPKLKLQRKINLIIYLDSNLKKEHGGQLGLWSHDDKSNQPNELIKEVDPVFNRAIIFDTTQNSWHGMSKQLTTPEHIYRKSLAIYYLCHPTEGADPRMKALFAPREEQKNDQSVKELIEKRSQINSAATVYINKK